MDAPRDPSKWLFRRPPSDATSVIVCFPYAGAGATSYRSWPAEVGDAFVVPVQPPGRENRLAEPPFSTHADYAEDLGTILAALDVGSMVFFAHCGGVPFALETADWLCDNGYLPPRKIVSSSWGPPHADLYGGLNKVDIETYDFVGEVLSVQRALGNEMPRPLAKIAAKVLRQEVEVHRPWLYDASTPISCPVIALGWTDDDVVPNDVATDLAWSECGDVTFATLEGDHWAFEECPAELVEILIS